MYSILYNLFFFLKRKDKRNNGIFSKMCLKYYDMFDFFLNVVFVKFITYFKSNRCGVTKKKHREKVIVSLTSFPARIDKVWVTIETIFRQSVKADEVILWLADEQFDGIESLPKRLQDMTQRGLQIRFCDDLKSHKKYYYAFLEHKNDLVITMDDDIFYPKDRIKQLLKMHKKHPNDVISTMAQGVPNNIKEVPSQWFSLKKQAISSRYAQAFTGTGALFQPKMYNDVLFDKELIKSLAPTVDDLWLYIIGYLSGVTVTTFPQYACFDIAMWGTAENSLFQINGSHGGNNNDISWEKLINYFDKAIKTEK